MNWPLFLLLLPFALYFGLKRGRERERKRRHRGEAKGSAYQAEAYRKYPNPLQWKEREEYLDRCYRDKKLH